MMWSFEHTVTTGAAPSAVWARYADPAAWPSWDRDLASVTVDGPIAVGVRGTLRPLKGPPAVFVFTEVEPDVGFTNVSRLPFAKLAVSHRITPASSGSEVTHRVEINGPLAPLFGRLIGRRIAAALPGSMRTLAELAEESRE